MSSIKLILAASFMSFFIGATFAQPTLDWAGMIYTGTNEFVKTVKTDVNGDVYVYGQCQTTTNDFDIGAGTYNVPITFGQRLFVAKYSSAGIVMWVKMFGIGAIPSGMDIDNLGNIYLTGTFNSTIDLDPSIATYSITAQSSASDIFYSKLTTNGDFVWGFRWGGGDYENSNSIKVDNAGYFYSTGYFEDAMDFDPGAITQWETAPNGSDDAFVTKWDLNGNYVWGARMGGTGNDVGYSVDVDASGNVITVGTFTNTADFDPSASDFNMLSAGNLDTYISKLSSAGNFIWAKQVGGISPDYPDDCLVDDSDNIFVVGHFASSVDFDPSGSIYNMTSTGSYDPFVLKLNSLGEFGWSKQFESPTAGFLTTIDMDDYGNIFCAGNYTDSIDINPGIATEWIYTTGGVGQNAKDALMVMLTQNGDYQWSQSFGSSLGEDRFMDVHVENNSAVYGVGMNRGGADLDPGPTMLTFSPGGETDIFVQKLGYCPNTTSSISVSECTSYTSPSANYTWTSTGLFNDTISNMAGCDSIIVIDLTIGDLLAPIADLVSLSDITTACGQSVTSLTAPTANDNCIGAVVGTHNATLPITAAGTTVVTWTYDDGNGNTSTQTQNVIINADVITPLADAGSLTDLNDQCSIVSLTAPTATDNCIGSIVGTHNATLPITTSSIITWTYDDGNGNTSTQTQNVVINDITAPIVDAGSLTDLNDQCNIVSLTAPTATDNCIGSIVGTHNATLPITTSSIITWTYDDGNGNTSTQTQNVVINDITAPIVDAGSLSDVTAECSIASIVAPTATDNCIGTVAGTPNISFPITSQGAFTVTWTYDDGNGNVTTQSQNVIIDDVTDPVVDNAILSPITQECALASLTAPTATDNCVGSLTGVPDVTFPITASTTITWSYDDGNGNITTQTQSVSINGDATAPVPDLASLPNITNECSVTSLTPPTATDNCGGIVTVTNNATLPITTQGTTTVTWTYDDGNGNTTTQTQDVIITPIDNGITQVDAVTLSADATGYNYQWVDCDNGNAAVSGATSQVFTPTVAGSYACEIDNGTCTVTTTCLTSSVGITENSFGTALVVYPNPTFGNLKVDLGDVYSETTVKVFNALGQIVINEAFGTTDEINIEIKGTPGMYILEIKTEEGKSARVNVIKE